MADASPPKILFVVKGRDFVRFVGPVFGALRELTPAPQVRALCIESEDVADLRFGDAVEWLPDRVAGHRARVITRDLASYLLMVRRGDAPWDLLARHAAYFPLPLALAHMALHRTRLSSWLARTPLPEWMRGLEAKGTNPGIAALLRRERPDVVVVTPGLYPLACDAEFVLEARRLGIATMVYVATWDNLSSKGVFHYPPDRLMVWNDVQATEAETLHGIPAERIDVTGAAVFDENFAEAPASAERAAWCARVGLDADRPYLLWAASSPVATPDEPGIVLDAWHRLRAAVPDLQLLVRPHPKERQPARWDRVFAAGPRACPDVGFPGDQTRFQALQQAIAHSAGTLGLSTSLFLEAAILDRPCAIWLPRELPAGALFHRFTHFEYLERCGLATVVRDPERLAAWAKQALAGADAGGPRAAAVRFLRPHGESRAAATIAAERIVELAGRGRARR